MKFTPIKFKLFPEDEIKLQTMSREEKAVFMEKIRNEHIKLLIAPRHPERNDAVFSLCKQTGVNVGKRSLKDNFVNNDIILLDTMGELGKMYSICDFAFIGGSFNKTGGHNPLEACIFNKPVISGPSIHNFKDIYAIITRCEAGKIVNSEQALVEQMNKLLNDNEYYKRACDDCKLVFEENRGAINRVIEELKNLL